MGFANKLMQWPIGGDRMSKTHLPSEFHAHGVFWKPLEICFFFFWKKLYKPKKGNSYNRMKRERQREDFENKSLVFQEVKAETRERINKTTLDRESKENLWKGLEGK